MVKKILGWIIFITLITGAIALKVIDTMVSLQVSLIAAIGLTFLLIMAIAIFVALLILAMSWIFD